jgi:hypothetical protein
VIGDGPNNSRDEGFANGDGPPLGREIELAEIFAALHERGVRGPGQVNLAPWDGLQSFGTADVTPDHLAVRLCGIDGRDRDRIELPIT